MLKSYKEEKLSFTFARPFSAPNTVSDTINKIIEKIDNETLFIEELDNTALEYCQTIRSNIFQDDLTLCQESMRLPAEDAMQHILAVYLLIIALIAKRYMRKTSSF